MTISFKRYAVFRIKLLFSLFFLNILGGNFCTIGKRTGKNRREIGIKGAKSFEHAARSDERRKSNGRVSNLNGNAIKIGGKGSYRNRGSLIYLVVSPFLSSTSKRSISFCNVPPLSEYLSRDMSVSSVKRSSSIFTQKKLTNYLQQ